MTSLKEGRAPRERTDLSFRGVGEVKRRRAAPLALSEELQGCFAQARIVPRLAFELDGGIGCAPAAAKIVAILTVLDASFGRMAGLT